MEECETKYSKRLEERSDCRDEAMPHDVNAFFKHPLGAVNQSQQGMALLHEFQILSDFNDKIPKHELCAPEEFQNASNTLSYQKGISMDVKETLKKPSKQHFNNSPHVDTKIITSEKCLNVGVPDLERNYNSSYNHVYSNNFKNINTYLNNGINLNKYEMSHHNDNPTIQYNYTSKNTINSSIKDTFSNNLQNNSHQKMTINTNNTNIYSNNNRNNKYNTINNNIKREKYNNTINKGNNTFKHINNNINYNNRSDNTPPTNTNTSSNNYIYCYNTNPLYNNKINIINENNKHINKNKANINKKNLIINNDNNSQALNISLGDNTIFNENQLLDNKSLPFNAILTKSNELSASCESMEDSTENKEGGVLHKTPLKTKPNLMHGSEQLSKLMLINRKAEQFLQKLAKANASSSLRNDILNDNLISKNNPKIVSSTNEFNNNTNNVSRVFNNYSNHQESTNNVPITTADKKAELLNLSLDLSTSQKLDSRFHEASHSKTSANDDTRGNNNQANNVNSFQNLSHQTANPLTTKNSSAVRKESFENIVTYIPINFDKNKLNYMNTNNFHQLPNYYSNNSIDEAIRAKSIKRHESNDPTTQASCNDFLSKIPALPFPLPSVPSGYRLVITHLPINNHQQPDSKNITQLIIDNPKKKNNNSVSNSSILFNQAASQLSQINKQTCDPFNKFQMEHPAVDQQHHSSASTQSFNTLLSDSGS